MNCPNVPLLTSSSALSVDKAEVINVSRLVEARKNDISEFLNKLAEGRKHNRSFQRLPYHQRRRAMSHNPFRVPKRYRLPIIIDMLSGRKLKRRISRVKWRKDLRMRRFGENKWLTTHIFHAKRFKMINIWGYKLAETPTLKCQRRIYKSLNISSGCLIYDKSYFTMYSNCEEMPLKTLKIRKNMLFYDQNGILISPIHIMHSNSNNVIVSIHPSSSLQFLEYIKNNKNMYNKYNSINVLFDDIHKVKDLSHFELLGPQSLNIINKIFKLNEFKENDYIIKDNYKLLKNSSNGSIFHLKVCLPKSAFNKFDSVESEKLLKLKKNVKILTKTKKNNIDLKVLEREKLKLENELGKEEDFKLENQSDEDDIQLDIVIIVRHLISSFKPYKRVSGFDLLIPSQISKYVWNKLYKNGALPIGLKERRKIYLELGQLIFPEDYPETLSGYNYHSKLDEERYNKYLKLNPRHRPNYTKLNVQEPFSIINLLSILSNKSDKFTRTKFIHAIVTSIKRCVPREMCRIYSTNENGIHEQVGFVISGCNTFTKGKGFAKCLILNDLEVENNKFMAKNINSNHYFPVQVEKIKFNNFID